MRRSKTPSATNSSGRAPNATMALLGALLFCPAPQVLAKEIQAEPAQETRDEPKRQLVISIPDLKLALVGDGRVLKVYPVAVGAPETPSPAGQFRIINRVVAPSYHHEGKVIPPGPANPLGSRWMGLSRKGYGIHGTNVPSSIGKHASHGCIRMRMHDVEELFTLVRVDDAVEIHSRRDAELQRIFGGAAPQTLSASNPTVRPARQHTAAYRAALAGEL